MVGHFGHLQGSGIGCSRLERRGRVGKEREKAGKEWATLWNSWHASGRSSDFSWGRFAALDGRVVADRTVSVSFTPIYVYVVVLPDIKYGRPS